MRTLDSRIQVRLTAVIPAEHHVKLNRGAGGVHIAELTLLSPTDSNGKRSLETRLYPGRVMDCQTVFWVYLTKFS